MHVVVGEVGGEEAVDQLPHLFARQSLARLDRALAGEGHGDALVLVARGAHQLGTVGQLADHLAQASFGVEVRVRVGHRVRDDRVASKPVDLEAGAGEHPEQRFDVPVLGGRQGQRDREEKALAGLATLAEGVHQLLEEDAFVRGVLVDHQDAPAHLDEDVRLVQLPETGRLHRVLLGGGRRPGRCGGSAREERDLVFAGGSAGLRVGLSGRIRGGLRPVLRGPRGVPAGLAHPVRENGVRLGRVGAADLGRGVPAWRDRIHRGGALLLRERAPHLLFDEALHGGPVAEAHLELGGMHIHIHLPRGQIDVEEEPRTDGLANGGAIRPAHRVVHPLVPEGPAAHEEVDPGRAGTRLVGTLQETAHPAGPALASEGKHRGAGVVAPKPADPAGGTRVGRQFDQDATIGGQGEGDLRIGQGEGGELGGHHAGLGGRALEEVPPGGRVEEEVRHLEGGAAGARVIGNGGDSSAGRPAAGARVRVVAGLEGQPGDRGDRGQRLAPEAKARDAAEFAGAGDLAGGVALQAHDRILAPHADAVIDDADALSATPLHLDPDVGGGRVQRVFDQLLHDRRRTLDDLPRGDLVGHRVRQHLDGPGARGQPAPSGSSPKKRNPLSAV